MTSEPVFHLGIIGGCLARQPGLPICLLYQYELDRMLRSTIGVGLRPHVARYADGEYERRLAEMAAGARLDGVVMFVRLLTVRKTGVIVKHRAAGVTTYALHPFLFRRGGPRRWDDIERAAFAGCLRWQRTGGAGLPAGDAGEPDAAAGAPVQDLVQDRFDAPPVMREVRGISFGRVNRWVGRVLGLEDWTIADEISEVARVRDACGRLGIPLLVFGPLPAPYAAWIERYNARMRAGLRRAAAHLGFSYADISGGREATAMAAIMGDGVHVNAEGHRLVAAALYDTVAAWARPRQAPAEAVAGRQVEAVG